MFERGKWGEWAVMEALFEARFGKEDYAANPQQLFLKDHGWDTIMKILTAKRFCGKSSIKNRFPIHESVNSNRMILARRGIIDYGAHERCASHECPPQERHQALVELPVANQSRAVSQLVRIRRAAIMEPLRGKGMCRRTM